MLFHLLCTTTVLECVYRIVFYVCAVAKQQLLVSWATVNARRGGRRRGKRLASYNDVILKGLLCSNPTPHQCGCRVEILITI